MRKRNGVCASLLWCGLFGRQGTKLFLKKKLFWLINASWFSGIDGSFGPILGVFKSIIDAETATWVVIKIPANGALLNWCVICRLWNWMSMLVCWCDIQLLCMLLWCAYETSDSGGHVICGWVFCVTFASWLCFFLVLSIASLSFWGWALAIKRKKKKKKERIYL